MIRSEDLDKLRIWFPKTPYLEVCFENPDDLSARRSKDCDGLNWQVLSLKAQLSSSSRCDHGSNGLRVFLLGNRWFQGLRAHDVTVGSGRSMTG